MITPLESHTPTNDSGSARGTPREGDAPPPRSPGNARAAMQAHAVLGTTYSVAPARAGRTRVTTLRSEAPFVLRPTTITSNEPGVGTRADIARVSLAAGAAGPVGGDELSLHITVGPGSTLVLREISATLLLPGPHGQRSRIQTRIQVHTEATLIWVAQPIIAAHGCHHLNDIHVDLAEGARLLLREELLLGRHGESPGNLAQHMHVRLDGGPLYHQHLHFGPNAPAWTSPAVTGSHRAIGSVLVVDPSWTEHPPPARVLAGDAAVLPLVGPAALISALGTDSLVLRHALNAGLHALGAPWDPSV